MDLKTFKQLPVMGILRGVAMEIIPALTETIIRSGLKTVEITMNTQGAPELIRRMSAEAKGQLTIGAGTVLSVKELDVAVKSGASFIVLPVLVKEVVEECVRRKIPVFPGALTPQEIYLAWAAGASMVKVFPAKFWGPEYLKEIKGPFADIELLACGGVTAENIKDFFRSGAAAVAFGGGVFRKEWMTAEGLIKIEAAIQKLLSAFLE